MNLFLIKIKLLYLRIQDKFVKLIRSKSIKNIDTIQINAFPGMDCKEDYAEFLDRSRKFDKFVVWGLRTQEDTFRNIHRHFYETLEKMGAQVIWVDDDKKNIDLVKKNDLVIAVNVAAKYLPINPNAFYCLHNINTEFNSKKITTLQVYTKKVEEKKIESWQSATKFDHNHRVLYQPWGTNLLPHEFLPPIFNPESHYVFWIGSIWNNIHNQGNINQIQYLKQILAKEKIAFLHAKGVSDKQNIMLTRDSRIAPAIAGEWQADKGYLPCRMFKNISYGQLGISNVNSFSVILGENLHVTESLEELIHWSLSLTKKEYIDKTRVQQNLIKKHTYLQKLNHIMRTFE